MAGFEHPESFSDGELLLEAEFLEFSRWGLYQWPGLSEMTLEGRFRFVGGSEYSRVSGNGAGFEWVVHGTFGREPAELPDGYLDLGYVSRFTINIWTDRSVSVQPTTWGRIKRTFGAVGG
jgi:hypothetical protein